jgi:asparagine synthase (glutamine-hydrolysing)
VERTEPNRAEGLTLDRIDIATGMLVGRNPEASPLCSVGGTDNALEVLTGLLVEALSRPPCLISFSGGRDSSALLCVAVDAARRNGLPLPVPVTARFPAVEETLEDDWQELVIEHLGLGDWLRVEMDEEVDLLGPVALAVLRKHGLLYPSNAHLHAPLFSRARGGSFVTGLGGDELFSPLLWNRVSRLRHGERHPRPLDLVRLAVVSGPPRLRARAVSLRQPIAPLPWLRSDVERSVRRAAISWYASQPVEADRALREWWWPSRYLHVGRASLELLARERDVVLCQPFTDPEMIAAVAAAAGPIGFPSRRSAMDRVFGELVPPALRARDSKASFDGVLVNRLTRAFAERWGGGGVDVDLVDPDQLRKTWTTPVVDSRSFLLLQKARLAEPDPS